MALGLLLAEDAELAIHEHGIGRAGLEPNRLAVRRAVRRRQCSGRRPRWRLRKDLAARPPCRCRTRDRKPGRSGSPVRRAAGAHRPGCPCGAPPRFEASRMRSAGPFGSMRVRSIGSTPGWQFLRGEHRAGETGDGDVAKFHRGRGRGPLECSDACAGPPPLSTCQKNNRCRRFGICPPTGRAHLSIPQIHVKNLDRNRRDCQQCRYRASSDRMRRFLKRLSHKWAARSGHQLDEIGLAPALGLLKQIAQVRLDRRLRYARARAAS